MVSNEFLAREILAHGAYVCFRRSNGGDVRRAGAAGIGLGLPWVRKTVVYHDGRVDVGRGPWGGASFRIVLPLRRGSGERVPPAPSS